MGILEFYFIIKITKDDNKQTKFESFSAVNLWNN